MNKADDIDVIATDIINILSIALEETIHETKFPIIVQVLRNIQKDAITTLLMDEKNTIGLQKDFAKLVNDYIKGRTKEELEIIIE